MKKNASSFKSDGFEAILIIEILINEVKIGDVISTKLPPEILVDDVFTISNCVSTANSILSSQLLLQYTEIV